MCVRARARGDAGGGVLQFVRDVRTTAKIEGEGWRYAKREGRGAKRGNLVAFVKETQMFFLFF